MEGDERRRLELADAAKRTLGEDAGITLMEMLPPVGWADVATKQDLDQRFDALEQRFNARLDALGHELTSAFRGDMVTLTWRYIGATGALFAAFSTLVTLVIRP